jgi:hypothetical protein
MSLATDLRWPNKDRSKLEHALARPEALVGEGTAGGIEAPSLQAGVFGSSYKATVAEGTGVSASGGEAPRSAHHAAF